MNFKKPWRSKTLWGVAVMVAAIFIDIPDEIKQVIPIVLPDAIDQIIGGIGAILAVYGRCKSDSKIDVLPWRKQS